MNRKITITGKEGSPSIFLDDIQIYPTRVEIDMSFEKSSAILTFEDIQIEADTKIENIREFTEKIRV